ncbi:MAG TPA: hypothetical protein VMY40_05690 [Anaerolineae bacterium]|nr:hypothetical protein [Anaerolineae bacterium]
MKAKVSAVLTVVVLVILLVGCVEEPTPTVSPIATPGVRLQVVPVWAAAQQESLTAEVVAAVVTAVISILLEVVPGLADKWGNIDSTYKRLAWLIGCLVVPLAILGAGCLGLDLGVVSPACDKQGAVEAFRVGFAAYFTGQVTFAVVGQAIRKQRKR